MMTVIVPPDMSYDLYDFAPQNNDGVAEGQSSNNKTGYLIISQ